MQAPCQRWGRAAGPRAEHEHGQAWDSPRPRRDRQVHRRAAQDCRREAAGGCAGHPEACRCLAWGFERADSEPACTLPAVFMV